MRKRPERLSQYLKDKAMRDKIPKIVGYILIAPAILSLLVIIVNLFFLDAGNVSYSPTSFYRLIRTFDSVENIQNFAFMAIAGAYLIKDSKN